MTPAEARAKMLVPPTLAAVRVAEAAGFVTVRPHSRLPLLIANYTDRCTFARAWDEVTRPCRGLVFDSETGEVVARGFDKFFNLGEPESAWVEGPPDDVTIKYDGSLGIGFVYRSELVWTTRGSFDSPHAADAARLWEAHHPGVRPPPGVALLTEIISPVTRNVVRYEWGGHVLLGMRWPDGVDCSRGAVVRWARQYGVRVTERVTGTVEDLAQRAAGMDATEEGFVARWGDERVKIKSTGYLTVARFLQGINARRVADCWYAQRRDLVEHHALADDLRGEIEMQWADLDARMSMAEEDLQALAAITVGQERREVALQHRQHPLFGCLMRRWDGKDPDLRLYVYRAAFPGAHPRAVGEDGG